MLVCSIISELLHGQTSAKNKNSEMNMEKKLIENLRPQRYPACHPTFASNNHLVAGIVTGTTRNMRP
jgi:hypothetical protein